MPGTMSQNDALYAYNLVARICTEVGSGLSVNVIGTLRKPGTITVKRTLIRLGIAVLFSREGTSAFFLRKY